ncbi:hypothetical protein N9N67_04995 [Bacteriovoracaceae bacterium]|nr:hypothetical protein [Bacteriovoracaceae bacterium]
MQHKSMQASFKRFKNDQEEILDVELKSTEKYLVIYLKDQTYYWPKESVLRSYPSEEKIRFSYQKRELILEKIEWEKGNKFKESFANNQQKLARNSTILMALILIIFYVFPTIKANIVEYVVVSFFSTTFEEFQIEKANVNVLTDQKTLNKLLLNLGISPGRYNIYFEKQANYSTLLIPPKTMIFSCSIISELPGHMDFVGMMAHQIFHLKQSDYYKPFQQLPLQNFWELIQKEKLPFAEIEKIMGGFSFNKDEEGKIEQKVQGILKENKLDFFKLTEMTKYYKLYSRSDNYLWWKNYFNQHPYSRKFIKIYQQEMFYSPVYPLSEKEWVDFRAQCEE